MLKFLEWIILHIILEAFFYHTQHLVSEWWNNKVTLVLIYFILPWKNIEQCFTETLILKIHQCLFDISKNSSEGIVEMNEIKRFLKWRNRLWSSKDKNYLILALDFGCWFIENIHFRGSFLRYHRARIINHRKCPGSKRHDRFTWRICFFTEIN